VLTVHEPVAVGGEVGLADDEVEVCDDLDHGEEGAVAVHAVHPDHRRVGRGLVVDHNPASRGACQQKKIVLSVLES
jgi:hypothetical protein